MGSKPLTRLFGAAVLVVGIGVMILHGWDTFSYDRRIATQQRLATTAVPKFVLDGETLPQAVAKLSSATGVPIVLDDPPYEENRLPLDRPLCLAVYDGSLELALESMVVSASQSTHDGSVLTWQWQDGRILITSAARRRFPQAYVYDLRDVVADMRRESDPLEWTETTRPRGFIFGGAQPEEQVGEEAVGQWLLDPFLNARVMGRCYGIDGRLFVVNFPVDHSAVRARLDQLRAAK